MYRIKYTEIREDCAKQVEEVKTSYSDKVFKSVDRACKYIEKQGLSEGRSIVYYSGLSKTLYIKCEVEKID